MRSRAALLDSLLRPDDYPAQLAQLNRQGFVVLLVETFPRLHVNAKPIHVTIMNPRETISQSSPGRAHPLNGTTGLRLIVLGPSRAQYLFAKRPHERGLRLHGFPVQGAEFLFDSADLSLEPLQLVVASLVVSLSLRKP